MFEWDDARYFLAIHRCGSLSSAARQLHVNQSTVSRRLAQLEERMRGRLFLRARDGLSLTPSGALLLPHVERMEVEAHAIERAALDQGRALTGTVRLTASDMLSARVVVPLLAVFRELHPGIDVELVADNRVLNLVKREADIALRLGRPESPQLVGRKLSAFATAPYASTAYLARRGHPEFPGCAGHEFIGFDAPLRGMVEDLWVERHARLGRVVLRTISTPVQLSAAVSGMGIGFLPCYLGDEEPALARVASPDAKALRAVWLILHADLQQAAPIRACADFLAQQIKRLRPRLEGLSARAKPAG